MSNKNHNDKGMDSYAVLEGVTPREKAMAWWNNLCLEVKFYKMIEHNSLIAGDKARHPSTMTGREIEIIFNAL